MKKKIDPITITNELKGASSFFRPVQENTEATPLVTHSKEKKQTGLLANQQTNKEENQQTSKQIKKFGSYLREDSIKALKRRAVEVDKKDYEVLQEALDLYFASIGKK